MKRKRTMIVAGVAAVVALVGLGGFALLVAAQQNRAEAERQVARANDLAANAAHATR